MIPLIFVKTNLLDKPIGSSFETVLTVEFLLFKVFWRFPKQYFYLQQTQTQAPLSLCNNGDSEAEWALLTISFNNNLANRVEITIKKVPLYGITHSRVCDTSQNINQGQRTIQETKIENRARVKTHQGNIILTARL